MSQSKYRQRLRNRLGLPDGGGINTTFVPTKLGKVTTAQQKQMAGQKTPAPPAPKEVQISPADAGGLPPIGRNFKEEERLIKEEAALEAKKQAEAQEEMAAAAAASKKAEEDLAAQAATPAPEPEPEAVTEGDGGEVAEEGDADSKGTE